MAFELNGLAQLAALPFDSVIDVRSPSEFFEDHIPGAINLPVLSDEERAKVGTIYVQQNPFLARKIGAALVARNAAAHLEGPLAERDGSWQPLVYCWRGGQRSGSFASILAQVGWRTEVLSGGYQSYRRHVVKALYDTDVGCRIVLLDGNTGTGKTEVLARLAKRGVAVLDLEGLANHRGSVLGGMGDQPSQKMFESRLAAALATVSDGKPLIVEAESSKIGRLNVPPRLFAAMRTAPRIALSAPVAARAAYLESAYRDVTNDLARLEDRLGRLVRLQGHDVVAEWRGMARAGRFGELATELIERHYDPSYRKVRARVGAEVVSQVCGTTLDDADLDRIADEIAGTLTAL